MQLHTQYYGLNTCFVQIDKQTKVVFLDEEVDQDTEQLCEEHESMPGADGYCHQQQLIQDERGEGDGHHVDKLPLKEEEPEQHDDSSLVEGD